MIGVDDAETRCHFCYCPLALDHKLLVNNVNGGGPCRVDDAMFSCSYVDRKLCRSLVAAIISVALVLALVFILCCRLLF